jgi:signal transduction histidine kinase
VENIDEKHLDKAVWLLPMYLLAINIFVLPIAFAGAMHLPQGADADTFVLTLPMVEQQQGLALLVFIGGLSAATGMIIVESIALSTMVCNDLVMPLLLRVKRLRLNRRGNLGGLLLAVRRAAIVLLMVLGYAYFRLAGEAAALVSIGLISFAAVAQIAPAMLGGIYWREGTRRGALVGLSAGFLLWMYTLLLPSFAHSGWLPAGLLAEGPFGIGWLRPQELFGLQGLDPISHGLFWSMLVNVGAYMAVSLIGTQGSVERTQAILFVDAYASQGGALGSRMWSGNASTEGLRALLTRFLGARRSADLFAGFEKQHGLASATGAAPALVHFAEIELAGAIGAASARAAIASVVDEHPPGRDELMAILDETSNAMAYSRELERTSQELRSATDELKAANQRLTELDQMKDDFVSTVTHELRTPLTSIRAFSEILRDHPDLPAAKRTEYLGIVIKESERLTRLINEVLDLSKIESGRAEWHESVFDLRQVIVDAVNASSLLFKDKQVQLDLGLPATAAQVCADRDRLMQVMLNLLSNAVKFCDKVSGRVTVTMEVLRDELRVSVRDNGPGVRAQDREVIFEKFRQGHDMLAGKPQGTGLGLPISREIISHFGGRLWLASAAGEGADFVFTLPQAAVREEAS